MDLIYKNDKTKIMVKYRDRVQSHTFQTVPTQTRRKIEKEEKSYTKRIQQGCYLNLAREEKTKMCA